MAEVFQEMDWMPEAEESFRRRYRILTCLSKLGKAGRRNLSRMLREPEGMIRKDIVTLSHLGLLNVTRGGLSLSEIGIYELSQIRSSDARRVRCIELEEQLSEYLPESHVHVAVSSRHLQWFCKKQNGAYPIPWDSNIPGIPASLIHTLELRDACTLFQGVILSNDGKPLYRMEKSMESSAEILYGGETVTGAELYAAWKYGKPKEIYMLYPEGKELLAILQIKEKHNAENRH